jgi:hypothetical protein
MESDFHVSIPRTDDDFDVHEYEYFVIPEVFHSHDGIAFEEMPNVFTLFYDGF